MMEIDRKNSHFDITACYIIFNNIYIYTDHTWIYNINNTTSRVSNTRSVETSTSVSKQSTGEVQVDCHVLTVENTDIGITSKKMNVSTLVEDNVGIPRDMSFTHNHETEELKNSNVVQNVLGDLQENSKDNIIDGTYEKSTESNEDEDSIIYIRNHVERLDQLNFDDSDVSIPDEEEMEL